MSTSLQILLEFILGSLLLYLSVRLQLTWFSKSIRKYLGKCGDKTLNIAIRCGIAFVGTYLLLDPLIPGQPIIHVHAPNTCPTRPENLRVKLAPIKIDGTIDPARMSYCSFAGGLVTEIVVFHVLEQRLLLELYDKTQKNPIDKRIVYLSPYIRCGIWDKHVYLKWAQQFEIMYPASNSTVRGEVIEVEGVGATQGDTIEINVLSSHWYMQSGTAEINNDGSWSYAPCYLSGQGQYSNHTIRARLLRDGRQVGIAKVRGVVRRDN